MAMTKRGRPSQGNDGAEAFGLIAARRRRSQAYLETYVHLCKKIHMLSLL
jgi:hypothetical protein